MDGHGPGCGLSTEGVRPKQQRELGAAASEGGLNDHTQKRIGLHLRAMYDTIVEQPVPDRFRELIAKLDASASGTDPQV